MTRENKFKGKRLSDGEWVYGDLLHNVDCVKIREWEADVNQIAKSYVVDENTIGQYTGKNDKNGDEIYSTHIIKVHQFLFDGSEYESELIGTVVYDNEYQAFCLTNIKHEGINKYMGYNNNEEAKNEIIPICMFYGLHEESFEIIGNIHDNPELLMYHAAITRKEREI